MNKKQRYRRVLITLAVAIEFTFWADDSMPVQTVSKNISYLIGNTSYAQCK
jgi:hypothetical protein